MSNVKIQTSLGDITVRLYDETPLHRDNFLKLAKENFYDGISSTELWYKQPKVLPVTFACK